MQPCANCGHPHAHTYCPECGQQRVAPGIRLREVVGDLIAGLYNVDAPILFTLRLIQWFTCMAGVCGTAACPVASTAASTGSQPSTHRIR